MDVRTNNMNSQNKEKRIIVRSQTAADNDNIEFTGPRLLYVTSYLAKVSYNLVKAENNIGRRENNEVVLTDSTISKLHATIFRQANGYICFNLAFLLLIETLPMVSV